MYEHHFKEMEDRIEKNLIAEAAVYISGMGMLTYPMPMFYQVWFECVLGKIAIRAGHYKAAKKQFEHAKDIWHGPNGWKSGDASIEDVKKQESHDRMIADNVEKCNRGNISFRSQSTHREWARLTFFHMEPLP